jgi:Methyltransferase domain
MVRLLKFFGLYFNVISNLTLGIFSKTGRQKLIAAYNVLVPPPLTEELPADPFIIQKTDILEVIGNDPAQYEGVYECGFGHITEFELKVIANITKKYAPNTIFEIGTFKGRTTLNMALNAPDTCKIYTLDLPNDAVESTAFSLETGELRYAQKPVSGERFINHPQQKKITQLFGDSASFDFSPYKGSMELIFIDGSHAADYVLNDTIKAFEMTKGKGSVILWHDYTNWVGVQEVMNKYYETDPRFKNLKHIGGTSILMLEL